MKWKEWEVVANDESLWRDQEEKGLLKAEYIGDYKLRLWFEEELDVSIYELDFYSLIVEDNPGGVFEGLKDREHRINIPNGYLRVQSPSSWITLKPKSIHFFIGAI